MRRNSVASDEPNPNQIQAKTPNPPKRSRARTESGTCRGGGASRGVESKAGGAAGQGLIPP
ncbi:hypothetical protein [Anaeromyxobacter oryzae]|uniref:hypothetical protein n=1 Tax=Anaeromyxobacter oryzae TaxID=2918170 RepID=UPI0020C0A30A|nr:hypothetical protein [Anaeromyxobacter oryzae]